MKAEQHLRLAKFLTACLLVCKLVEVFVTKGATWANMAGALADFVFWWSLGAFIAAVWFWLIHHRIDRRLSALQRRMDRINAFAQAYRATHGDFPPGYVEPEPGRIDAEL